MQTIAAYIDQLAGRRIVALVDLSSYGLVCEARRAEHNHGDQQSKPNALEPQHNMVDTSV
jgi:hydrogenase maturation factor HypF (carbamoyltransferase family)